MDLQPIFLSCTTLSDAWFSTVYKCLEVGREFIIDEGSNKGQKRLEYDYITVHIKNPNAKPLLPKIPAHYNIPDPVDENYLVDYIPYLMTAEKKKGESYTYGSRLCEAIYSVSLKNDKDIIVNHGNDNYWSDRKVFGEDIKENVGTINQIEHFIWTYKNKGFRNNQAVLQIAQPNDCILQDPPCLRHIDTRIQDGKLHFFPYFRSWDLWGGFPSNLAGLVHLQEYMAMEIGVEVGEMVASSKGLHLYNYVWELAEIIRGKTIEEFRNGK